jgi:AraC-like DNA-binding protein
MNDIGILCDSATEDDLSAVLEAGAPPAPSIARSKLPAGAPHALDGYWSVEHPFRPGRKEFGLNPQAGAFWIRRDAAAAQGAASARLLAALEDLARVRERGDSVADEGEGVEATSELYREWVDLQRTAPGDVEGRTKKLGCLLHCMAAASTLGEAIEFLSRFHGVIYDERSPLVVGKAATGVELAISEPLRPGAHGFVSDLWSLSLILRQLEFLVGGELDGVCAKVRHAPRLSPKAAALLFEGQLDYEAECLALVIPERHLARAIAVQLKEIPGFLDGLFSPVLARGARRPDMQSLIAGLLRNDKLRNSNAPATLESVSVRLGCGTATARRRLHAEGTRFREIRDRVFDDLAKMWLMQTDLRLDVIAERLGYSDVFAFRRSFRRCNGYSPSAYRRQVAYPADAAA